MRAFSALFFLPVLLLVVVLLAGCGEPVRVGIHEARAAGINVPGDRAARSPPLLYSSATTPAPIRPRSGSVHPAAMQAAPAAQMLYLPQLPQRKGSDDIVGLKLQHDGPLAARPITFGQVFIPGAFPRGSGLVARIGGHDVPAQLDVKTTNPDGSVRFGIVTLIAAAPADVMLVRHKPPTAAPVDMAATLGKYDLTVDLVMRDGSGDVTHHYAAATLLTDALRTGKVHYWLRGPLATEARVDVPVESSLRLTFDIRFYADGTTFTDVQFNNDTAMQPTGGTVEYAVTISEHGKPVFHQADVHQFQYQTWHREIWNSGYPNVNVVHDIGELERAGVIWNYDLHAGVSATMVAFCQTEIAKPGFTGVLSSADLTKYMPMTGGRSDIGPLPEWDVSWLMTQNAEIARYALAQEDAAGSIPWHLYDPATHTYMTVDSWPKLWTDPRGGHGPPGGLTQQIDEKAGWSLDFSHQPGMSYLAYLLTGSHYYLDQLDAQATWTVLGIWPYVREYGQGIVATKGIQLRGAAWSLRELVEAAYINPDNGPLTAYFKRLVANNFGYLLAEAKAAHQGQAYGWLQGVYGYERGTMAPWQQDFMATTVILAAEQGVPGAKELLTWQAHFLAGRFLAGDKGLSPYDGIAYNMQMWNDDPNDPFQTWHEIGAAVIAHHWSGGGSAWHPGNVAYYAAARGVLSGIVSVTHLPEAKQALEWVEAHPPAGSNGAWDQWDIVSATR